MENAFVATLDKNELNDLQENKMASDDLSSESSLETDMMLAAPMATDEDYCKEIVEILEINDIEAEYKDEKVIAKGNIEDIKFILANYEGLLDITEDGEAINIKIK